MRAQQPAGHAPGRASLAAPMIAKVASTFPSLLRNRTETASTAKARPVATPRRAPADPDAELRKGNRLVSGAAARPSSTPADTPPPLACRLAFKARSPASEALALLADQPDAMERANRQRKAERHAASALIDRAFPLAASHR